LNYLHYWRNRTGIAITRILVWVNLSTGKYYNWRKRYNLDNRHNGSVPKSHYILPWEKEAVIEYKLQHSEQGYRRLCYMMLDENIVALSPSTVYRILKSKGLLTRKWRRTKQKGKGFAQPSKPHEHWHMDITFINFRGTFVYLVALIDGYSRYIVHYELRMSVESLDIEIMLERAKLKYPGVTPVLITDNGPQFIANDLKIYLNESGITHRRTRFYYPQSNGKIERFNQTCKNELIRKNSFLNLEDLENQLAEYINIYNNERLHSSIGYVTPKDMLLGNEKQIFEERKIKLENARQKRKSQRTLNAA